MRGELRLWVVLLLGLCACGAGAEDGAIEACIADHPPAQPFDVGDTRGMARPASVPGGAPSVQPPPTAEDIAQECREQGGSGCDAGSFISRQAAECLGRELGLRAGLRPWEVSLGYFANHQRVAWLIMTVTVELDPSEGYAGESLVIDALSGEALAPINGYRVRP